MTTPPFRTSGRTSLRTTARTPLRTTVVAATVGVALAAGLAVDLAPAGASAGASSAGPVATYTKAACNRAIDERLFVLDISEQRIATVKRLTADQKAAQIAGIDAVQANLVDVNRPAVAAASGRAGIRDACRAIYTDNRVYAVVIPQLFASVRIEEFGNAFERFDPMIAEQRAKGLDTSAIEALETSAKAHVDTAAAIVSAITPDSFNTDPAGTKAKFQQATDELQAALGDVLKGIVAYRDLVSPTPAP